MILEPARHLALQAEHEPRGRPFEREHGRERRDLRGERQVLGRVERGVWIGHLAHEALLRREVIRHVVLQERDEARGLAAVSREHRVEQPVDAPEELLVLRVELGHADR